ncbi:glycosyltransferase [Salimicrobium jeotgali]|uniref:Glycosyl transferase family protein n=1 Tax=Salimicrobium jeotgali TaxID=1230341 RepID=K2GJJ6_9BACI|nr:glycosyltransferase family 2 protein [Salimicrobium jeotgali]AKG04862.1 glycosyltransferase [Salimicrobium jeotgali]EKE30609.1 glycosyl transferase family protein [Salimicrobium jeotgali]MBM7696843.1 glycosyltransferase involved in cell wall biosynthesis [Salimicrobium jeotgali]
MEELTVSIIIPAFNEGNNINRIHKELKKEFSSLRYDFEIIFVDDGSEDDTLARVRTLALEFPEVKYLSFSRNFGKEPALIAGLQHAKGGSVIIMDADLQHPPSLIPELLEGFEEGFQQVVARRNRVKESKVRSSLSSLYYKLVNKLAQVDLVDGEGDFRLLGRQAVDAILALSEGNRFSKGLFSWIGFDKKVVKFDNVQRDEGNSTWSLVDLFEYGIEGVLSFNQRPLRLVFYAGFFIMGLSLVYILIMFGLILSRGVEVPGYFTTISSILFLGGVQLISLGVIGEYVGRIYMETKRRPHYLVKESNTERETYEEME